MPIAFVGQTQASSPDGHSVAATLTTTGANLIVVALQYYGRRSVAPTITDSLNNTWTGLTRRTGTNAGIRMFYCLNPSVGSNQTFLFTTSNSYPSMSVLAFSGVTSYQIETGATDNAAVSLATGSVTPSENGCLIVAAETFDALSTESSTFTGLQQQNFAEMFAMGSASSYWLQAEASTISCTFSGSSIGRAAAIVCFRVVGAASFTSGTASVVSETNSTVQVTATVAEGGTSPYTYQWERSLTSGSGYSNVSGAIALTLTDTGLTNNTTYYYRLKSTDSAGSPATVTSNEVSGTPVNAHEVTVDDVHLYFSPYNWRLSGSSYAETNNPGAYFKFRFTGNAAILLVETTINASLSAGNYPAITYQINGGAFTRSQLTSGQSTVTLASGLGNASGPHTCIVYLDAAWWQSDRWTTPASALRVTGVRLTTGVVSAPDIYQDKCIVYGDSNTEGYEAAAAGVSVSNQKAIYAFGVLIGRALECEVGVVGFAGQGWITTGGGNVPTLANAWNLYSAGQSRLTGGLLSPAPKYVIVSHGQNDGSSDIVSLATSTLIAVRTAAPNAKIFLCVPQSQGQKANLTTVANATNATLIDAGEAFTAAPWAASSSHMNASGQGRYSAICACEILRASPNIASDVWYRLKSAAIDNGLELIEQ